MPLLWTFFSWYVHTCSVHLFSHSFKFIAKLFTIDLTVLFRKIKKKLHYYKSVENFEAYESLQSVRKKYVGLMGDINYLRHFLYWLYQQFAGDASVLNICCGLFIYSIDRISMQRIFAINSFFPGRIRVMVRFWTNKMCRVGKKHRIEIREEK